MVQTPDPHLRRDDRDLWDVGLSVQGWPATPLRDLIARLEQVRDDLQRDMVSRAAADPKEGAPDSARPWMWVHHAIALVKDELQQQEDALDRLDDD